MATYWVDYTNGDDGWPGTEGQPWRTLNKAATTAVAGDTVNYVNDTWNIGSGQGTWNSGSAGSGYITHQAVNSRQAIWEQTSYGANPIVLSSCSYIRFIGIKMRQAVITEIGKFVHIQTSDHIILDDCEVYNTSPHCVMLENGCSYVTVQNCSLHADTDTVGFGRNGVCLYGAGANTNILFDNCEMYDNPHTGLSSTAGSSNSDTIEIRFCRIWSNDSHCISAHKGYFNIHDNICIDAGGQGPRDDDKNGIRIVEDASADVYNNIIRDCTGSGIMIESDVDAVNVFRNTVENCNDVGNDYGTVAVLYRNTYDQGTIKIINNVFYHTQASRQCLYIESAANPAVTFMDYNQWYDSTDEQTFYRTTTYGTWAAYTGAGWEPNSDYGDPLFYNQAGHNYLLRSASPAIDAGYIGAPDTLEYNGNAPDRGALEREDELYQSVHQGTMRGVMRGRA